MGVVWAGIYLPTTVCPLNSSWLSHGVDSRDASLVITVADTSHSSPNPTWGGDKKDSPLAVTSGSSVIGPEFWVSHSQ